MAAGRGLKVVLGAGLIGLAAAGGLAWLGTRSPSLAPDFAAPDLSGQVLRLSSLRGKVVLVNLWATWCPPCREEMPSMERLHARLRGRDFQLLAVSEDEGGKDVVQAFVRQLGLSFPVLLDPERQVGERYEVWGYPETFVIDRNGYVVERVIGPRDWDSAESVAKLEALIGGAAPSPQGPRGPS